MFSTDDELISSKALQKFLKFNVVKYDFHHNFDIVIYPKRLVCIRAGPVQVGNGFRG